MNGAVVAWHAPGAGRSADPPERFGLVGCADCLAGFLEKLGLHPACVAGLSFGGILALALKCRHSAMSSALILASAYAGWAGSLPPEVAEQRLRQALALADGTPEALVGALLPTMFSKTMPAETVDNFRSSMQAFHPSGFRAMAWASAEDVRDVLPHIKVPTLLVYCDRDVRAPLAVAEALQAAISDSRLVVLPDAGHLQHRSPQRVQRRSPGLPALRPRLEASDPGSLSASVASPSASRRATTSGPRQR